MSTTIECLKLEPSISVSIAHCRERYQTAIDHPNDWRSAICMACDRGRDAFYQTSNAKEDNVTNKPREMCSKCRKHTAKRDGLCGWCLKKAPVAAEKSSAIPTAPPLTAKSGIAKKRPPGRRKVVKPKRNGNGATNRSVVVTQGLILTAAIDFGVYPLLLAQLASKSVQERRVLDDQLQVLLHEEFEIMEAALSVKKV